MPFLIMGGITIAGCQAPVFPEIAQVVAKENGQSDSSDGLARSYSLFNAAYGIGKKYVISHGFINSFGYRDVRWTFDGWLFVC